MYPFQHTHVYFFKEPRHLQFFSEFGNSDIYVSLAVKKKHGAPTNYGFCFKVQA